MATVNRSFDNQLVRNILPFIHHDHTAKLRSFLITRKEKKKNVFHIVSHRTFQFNTVQSMTATADNHQWNPSNCSKVELNSEVIFVTDKIGGGRYGKVYLAVEPLNNKRYALKIMNKRELIAKKGVDSVYKEISILRMLSHPFIVNCEGYFTDDINLYLATPFISGGDLYQYMMFSCEGPSETVARFYSAQIVLALEHLNRMRVIHRDLKPENLMIDDEGYLKIVDFGSSCAGKKSCSTFCGTYQYMAPEILLCREYDASIDYWSLGVIIYELTAFQLPFDDDNISILTSKIVDGRFEMKTGFTSCLKDLLLSLLNVDCRNRLGNDSIKNHSWFQNVDFDELIEKRVKPPHNFFRKTDRTATI